MKKLQINIRNIPIGKMRYKTVGDYKDPVIKAGWHNFQIEVADMPNIDYSLLIGLHELIESYLCFKRGIKDEEITGYDLKHLDDDDPGSNEDAPYHKEHMIAMEIEARMANELNVVWPDYEDAQSEAVKKIK